MIPNFESINPKTYIKHLELSIDSIRKGIEGHKANNNHFGPYFEETALKHIEHYYECIKVAKEYMESNNVA